MVREEFGASQRHEVVALGSAIVDIFCRVNDEFIEELGITKGSMELVGPELSHSVVEALGQVEINGGGSAANTLVGLAALGHEVTLIARTDLDELGDQYVSDLESVGIHVSRPETGHDLGTGRCLVMVTPDGERTMATWLGAASHLELDESAIDSISEARLLYIEGYLYDLETTKNQIHVAFETALKNDILVALSLSDPFCVQRHREEFLKLLDEDVSLVFANKDEAEILSGVSDVSEMVEFFTQRSLSGAITCGAEGAMVFNPHSSYFIPAQKVESVVDTTGAGDLFAAGFIHGILTLGLEEVETCGKFGVACSSEVIAHFGARPIQDLKMLIETT